MHLIMKGLHEKNREKDRRHQIEESKGDQQIIDLLPKEREPAIRFKEESGEEEIQRHPEIPENDT